MAGLWEEVRGFTGTMVAAGSSPILRKGSGQSWTPPKAGSHSLPASLQSAPEIDGCNLGEREHEALR